MLFYKDIGKGPIIVLLPGLLASSRYWEKVAIELASSFRVITIDQFGFGNSPKPDDQADYTIEENIKAYSDVFNSLKIKEIECLVGYSSSTILAVNFATKTLNSLSFKTKINRLLLITPPLHKSREESVEALSKSFLTYKYFMFGFLKPFFITFVTIFRPIIRFTSPLFLTHVEANSARDSFSFTWKSLYNSIENIIVNQNLYECFEKLHPTSIPIKILYAREDNIVNEENLLELPLKFPNISINRFDCTHQLPLEMPEKVIEAVLN